MYSVLLVGPSRVPNLDIVWALALLSPLVFVFLVEEKCHRGKSIARARLVACDKLSRIMHCSLTQTGLVLLAVLFSFSPYLMGPSLLLCPFALSYSSRSAIPIWSLFAPARTAPTPAAQHQQRQCPIAKATLHQQPQPQQQQ